MNFFKLFTLIFIAALTRLATDIYLPSLPSIARDFGVSMDQVQMTIAVFMIALTLTQLFWGPFSDKFGRKKTLFIGLIISMLGSLICIFANNIEWLNFGRLIQGIGCGAAAGLFRAILRDMYTGRQLASIGSYFSNFLVFVLMLAPMLGGFIEKNYSWHLSFAFLIIWCFLSLFWSVLLLKRLKEKKKLITWRLISVFSKVEFLWAAASAIFKLCWYVCLDYFLLSSLVDQLGMNPQSFGFWSGLTGSGLMVGAFLNGSLVKKLGSKAMLYAGWFLIISSGAFLLATSFLESNLIPMILISAFVFFLGSAFIYTNTNALAFSPFGDIAGTASGIYAFIQLAGGAAMSSFIASIGAESPIFLGLCFLISGLSSAIIFTTIYRESN